MLQNEEFEEITDEKIKEACEWLEFYDKHRFFPFQKKKILIDIDYLIIKKMHHIKNKSKFINGLLKVNLD